MRDSKVIAGFAGLVTLAAVTTMALVLGGGFLPRIDSKPHEAAGWGLAQQTLNLLKPGGKVTVIVRDTATFNNPATDIQLSSFKAALRKGRAEIESIHTLQVDPLRPVEVPPGDFLELIRKTPNGSVIVSFMGPPLLNQPQRNQLKEIKPAIVAFCAGASAATMDFASLFNQGLLHAAVVSRGVPSPLIKPSSLKGWFDHYFVAIVPNHAGQQSALSRSTQVSTAK